MLRQRGIEHEARLLERFAAEGRAVEVVTAADTPFLHRNPAAAATRTRDAMGHGADVIYQGRLEDADGRWSGYPDFLLRVDEPSGLGAWSYEVLDAKLARGAKGAAVLQLLLYSDLLALAQGAAPERMHLALGGGDERDHASFRVVEYSACYRAVRRGFEAHAEAPPETYPEPVEHCGLCEWKQSCAERRRADDHLSLVAGITRGQRARLAERGVTTMTALGALDLPAVPRLDGVSAGALARIRDQARVQDQARCEGRRIHELVTPVEPDKGLAALPGPSAGDVFFDLEGDPFAADGGLEYLFGAAYRNGRYDADWALDATGEKAAFERFIDRVMARWEQHPGFHIYHYGAYETTAVKRLMSRYATREDEVDRLLRGRVFVDLHRVVRQGVRASVESYSIKRLEPFYGFVRRVDLLAATRALIRFEVRLESGDAAAAPDELRTEIGVYRAVRRLLGGSVSLAPLAPPHDDPTPAEVAHDADLSGQVFVFTGFRDEVLAARIQNAGGAVAGGISRKVTTLLVADDDARPTGKMRKARDYGITVRSKESFEREFTSRSEALALPRAISVAG